MLATYNAEDEETDEGMQVYAKKDAQLYGERNSKDKFVSMPFMKKYIHVAKNIKVLFFKWYLVACPYVLS